MGQGKILPKKDLDKLLKRLKAYGEVFAPVDRDVLRWERVEDSSEICFDGLAWFPPKKFVYPEMQELFSFKDNKITAKEITPKKIVFFGLRLCDTNAFSVNDSLLLDKYPDENYRKLRESILLVGLNCAQPVDRFCFCDSMELKPYYDLFLYDLGNHYHIKSGSEKGLQFVKDLKDEEYEPEKMHGCKTALMTKNIRHFFNDPEWEKIADECFSCGLCTHLCPTCLCFDIKDETGLDLKSGKRVFEWDSCMFRDFTKVAGGNIFREPRLDRFKHRIYHKLVYFKEQFGRYMCTGCGRCIRQCPMKIYWPGVIDHIYLEKTKENAL